MAGNTVGSSVKAVGLVGFDAADLTGGYDVMNVAGLTHACFCIRLYNQSNVDVFVSYDGATLHDFIEAGNRLEIYFQTNSQSSGHTALMRKGQRVYLVGPQGGGKGYLYLVGYYQD